MKRIIGTIVSLAWITLASGQSSGFYLNPATMSPNIVTITAVVAGEVPTDPLTNNSSQSIVYAWKEQGGWGSSTKGQVDVNCWWMPGGFTIKVQADNNSGTNQRNGLSNGLVTLNSTYQPIIYNIRSTSTISRVLTQSVLVTDFGQLGIGQYSVTINYRLSY